jgi:hypothetical protein
MQTSTRILAAVAVAAVLSQPIMRAQTGPNLTIAMSHTGDFTIGVNGVYSIVISNIGGTASTGLIGESVYFPNLPNTTSFGQASATGTGWSCSVNGGIPAEWIRVTCVSTSVIAAGGSASPITLTVTPFGVSGTVTNEATVSWGTCCPFHNNTASDVTIVLPAVPTLPQWALIALTGCLALAGVTALRRRTT